MSVPALTPMLEDVIPRVLEHYNIPGLSLSIVKDGQVVHEAGYGVTDLESRTPVDRHTRFCIGSVTKGFTSALLASILQHRRDITWDTPLVKILGKSFKMADDVLTSRVNLRDLLSHRCGIELGETEMGLFCGHARRDQFITHVQHLPITSDLRTKMMYNNFLYTLAGHVAEVLMDQKWEDLIQNTFFDVLGMKDATFISSTPVNKDSPGWKDFAKPHMKAQDKLLEIDLAVHRCISETAPCGMICASATDMTHWMRFLLNGGVIDGIPVVKKSLLEECQKPQFALPRGKPEWSGYISRPTFPATETRDTYGLGWCLGTYREFRYCAHTGEIGGFDTLLTLYPEMNIGIYTSINGPAGGAAYIANQLLQYHIADHLLGLTPWLDMNTITSFPEPWKPRESYYPQQIHTDFIKGLEPSGPPEQYVGTYRHPFLGDIVLEVEDGVVSMKFGPAAHFHLHPNGMSDDEFRMEGQGVFSFLHQVDLFSPSDWMTVKFNEVMPGESTIGSLCCSLFETGPTFDKVS